MALLWVSSEYGSGEDGPILPLVVVVQGACTTCADSVHQ